MDTFFKKNLLTICLLVTCSCYAQKFTTKADSKGNIIEKQYIDDNGKPVLYQNNYASLKSEYNEQNKIVKRSYFGLKAEPILHRDGYSITTLKYDSIGNIVEQTYFGTNGKPIIAPQGYSKLVREFDNNKNITKESCFDTLFKPILFANKYASFSKVYDAKKRVIKEAYFGTDGELHLQPEGYAARELNYASNDSCSRIEYYGEDGKLMLFKGKYAIIQKQFDKQGNCVKIEYYGTDNSLLLFEGKYAIVKREYDSVNQVLNEYFFDASNTLCMQREGYAGKTFKYDNRGNNIEIRYFGADGKAMLKDNLYHCYQVFYDTTGGIEKEVYRDITNKIIVPGGCLKKSYKTYPTTPNILIGNYFPVENQIRFDSVNPHLTSTIYNRHPLHVKSFTKRLLPAILIDNLMHSQNTKLYEPHVSINQYSGLSGLEPISKKNVLENLGYEIDTISILNEVTGKNEVFINRVDWNSEDVKTIKFIENWDLDTSRLQLFKNIMGYELIRSYFRKEDIENKEELLKSCVFFKQEGKQNNKNTSEFQKVASVCSEYIMYYTNEDTVNGVNEIPHPYAPAMTRQTWEFILKKLIDGIRKNKLAIKNNENGEDMSFTDLTKRMKNLSLVSQDNIIDLRADDIRSAIFDEDIYYNPKTFEIRKIVNSISPIFWTQWNQNKSYNKVVLATIPFNTSTSSFHCRNELKDQEILGTWKATVFEFGDSLSITWTIFPNGRSVYRFDVNNESYYSSGYWNYSHNVVDEKYENGNSGQGTINWISNDEFDLTIQFNGDPQYKGITRKYKRVY